MRIVRLQRLCLVINVLKRDPGIVSLMPVFLGILIHGRWIKAIFITESEVLAVVVPLSFIQFGVEDGLAFREGQNLWHFLILTLMDMP